MARRDRKRRPRGENPGPRPSEPHRENIPGPLDHASGAEEEFEAAIIEGAGGVPADDPNEDALAAFGENVPGGEDSDSETVDDDYLEREALSAGPAARRATGGVKGAPAPHQPAAGRGIPRFIGFLRACWAELQRVQWPDRRQVGQATAVVLGFVVVAGAYLGVADAIAQRVVDLIL